MACPQGWEQGPEEVPSGEGFSYKNAVWPRDANVRADPDFSCFFSSPFSAQKAPPPKSLL